MVTWCELKSCFTGFDGLSIWGVVCLGCLLLCFGVCFLWKHISFVLCVVWFAAVAERLLRWSRKPVAFELQGFESLQLRFFSSMRGGV